MELNEQRARELTGPRVEVRCCCNPARLYGTLALNGEPQNGQRFRFPIPPRFTDGEVTDGAVDPAAAGGEVLLEVAVVTLGSFCPLRGAPADAEREWFPALKYHGDDLEFVEKARNLLHIPGFEPSAEARAALGMAPARGLVWP